MPAVIVNFEPLRLLESPPFGPDDKGSTYTDMSLGQAGPAPLTDRERALLGLARAAIEASRAAGTLEIPPPPEVRLAPVLDADAQKLARLRSELADAPVAIAGDPHGLGGAAPSSELVGPVQPTAEERAKLEALLPEARTETPAVEVE
jgi:hypothetical protein